VPTPQQVHVDGYLTNYAVQLGTGSFAGPSIFPTHPVNKQSDLYPIYGRENITDDVITIAAPGVPAPEIEWALTNGTYFAHKRHLKKFISREENANADQVINVRNKTTMILGNKLRLGQEKRIRDLILTAGNNGTVVAAGFIWSNASSDPEKDLDDARDGIEVKSGFAANTVVISAGLAKIAKRHAKLRDLVKYTDPTLLVNGDLPPTIFGLKVVIPGAVNNTAHAGQTPVVARVWPNSSVWVGYVDPNPGPEAPTYGLTFSWMNDEGPEGVAVYSWWDNDRDGEHIRYAHWVDERLTSAECGALITGTA
jgi:hypothetical protein